MATTYDDYPGIDFGLSLPDISYVCPQTRDFWRTEIMQYGGHIFPWSQMKTIAEYAADLTPIFNSGGEVKHAIMMWPLCRYIHAPAFRGPGAQSGRLPVAG